jgi:hypothetical protein
MCIEVITVKEIHQCPLQQGSGDFCAQLAKIRPFTTSTGFFRI